MAESLGLGTMELILILALAVLIFAGPRIVNFIMRGQESEYDDESKPLLWPKWFIPAAIFLGVITLSRPWANPSFTYTKIFVTILVLTITGIVGVWAHRGND